MSNFSKYLAILCLSCLSLIQGFTVSSLANNQLVSSQQHHLKSTTTSLNNIVDNNQFSILLDNATPFSSNTIAAATVDPTTALTQVLSGILNTPLILLVPILAAVLVASAVAWFIVSYANPADPDE